jgi:kynurenine 3-monooxygenase
MPSVAVVGAGLVGCLAALGLSKQGYEITLFEVRGGE